MTCSQWADPRIMKQPEETMGPGNGLRAVTSVHYTKQLECM